MQTTLSPAKIPYPAPSDFFDKFFDTKLFAGSVLSMTFISRSRTRGEVRIE